MPFNLRDTGFIGSLTAGGTIVLGARTASSAAFADVDAAVNGGTDSHGRIFVGAAPTGTTVVIPANVPDGGTWSLGAAALLPFNISASALLVALRTASVVPLNTTISGTHTQGYQITWPANGLQTLLTGDATLLSNGLSPNGLNIAISKIRPGTAGVTEIQYVAITSDWSAPLTIPNGITLQGQTTVSQAYSFVAGASLGASLSNALFNGSSTLTVDSTTGFAASGLLDITSSIQPMGLLLYTNKTLSTFTGVQWISGSGTLSATSFVGQGSYVDKTIISSALAPTFIIANNGSGDGTCDVSGLTVLRGSQATPNSNGNFQIKQSQSFRIHDCHVGSRYGALNGQYFYPLQYNNAGVIDHNIIEETSIGNQSVAYNGGVGNNDDSWSKPSDFLDAAGYGRGGPNHVFYEDNYIFAFLSGAFVSNGDWDGTFGCRFVVRHNRLIRCKVGGHGTEGGIYRGTRHVECYNNIFITPQTNPDPGSSRSGTLLFHNNDFYGATASGNWGSASADRSWTDYSNGQWGGGADGLGLWDFSDSSTGTFNSRQRPTGNNSSPPSGGSFSYGVVSDGYYVGKTSAGTVTAGASRSLTDTAMNGGTWASGQFVGFVVRRVVNATSPQSPTYSGGTINLNTLTGTQSLALSSVTGLSTRGCLTVTIAGIDCYIIYTAISGNSVTGCMSRDSGSLTNGAVMKWGDGLIGKVQSNTSTTFSLSSYSEGTPPVWVAGDRYTLRRTLCSLDQPGRGKTDQLNNSIPHALNGGPNNGKVAFPNCQMEPIYLFRNVYHAPNGSTSNVGVTMDVNAQDLFLQDRDYFIDTQSFVANTNFSSGVAAGTHAQRPSGSNYSTAVNGGPPIDITGATSPVPFVGYWETTTANPQDSNSTGVLFVLTANSTWSQWYAPYIYPHPLTLT